MIIYLSVLQYGTFPRVQEFPIWAQTRRFAKESARTLGVGVWMLCGCVSCVLYPSTLLFWGFEGKIAGSSPDFSKVNYYSAGSRLKQYAEAAGIQVITYSM